MYNQHAFPWQLLRRILWKLLPRRGHHFPPPRCGWVSRDGFLEQVQGRSSGVRRATTGHFRAAALERPAGALETFPMPRGLTQEERWWEILSAREGQRGRSVL